MLTRSRPLSTAATGKLAESMIPRVKKSHRISDHMDVVRAVWPIQASRNAKWEARRMVRTNEFMVM
jgi:hypothetical protein